MAVSGVTTPAMPRNCGMENMHGGAKKAQINHQQTETEHQQHKPEIKDQYRGQKIDVKA